MKRNLKRILLLVFSAVMLLALCSCYDFNIEDDRLMHAKLQEDGSVILNGDKYISIPVSNDFDAHNLSHTYAYLTEHDVPLLLSSMLGDYIYVDKTGTFISTISDYYYCREDMYDAYMSEANAINRQYYWHKVEWGYDQANYNARYEIFTRLDDTFADIVKQTVSPTYLVTDTTFTEAGLSKFTETCELSYRTESTWFVGTQTYSSTYLCYLESSDTYYLRLRTWSGNNLLYRVPQKYNEYLAEVIVSEPQNYDYSYDYNFLIDGMAGLYN